MRSIGLGPWAAAAVAMLLPALGGTFALAQDCAAGAICERAIPPPPPPSAPPPPAVSPSALGAPAPRRFGTPWNGPRVLPAPTPTPLAPAGLYRPRRFGEPAPDTYTVRLPDDAPPPETVNFAEPGAPARNLDAPVYVYRGRACAPLLASDYLWPQGQAYRRYTVGMRLPQSYWIAPYVMTRYASAGFDRPKEGAQWIRYGPDLLMVDLAVGDVIEVVYGVFDTSEASASPRGSAEF